jgi:dynein heavy chain
MYPSDEKAQIMEAARDKGSKEGKMLETMADVWKFFVDKCKANLHIIFAMSPVGQAFKDRLRQFPSLVNCCTIDWFQVYILVPKSRSPSVKGRQPTTITESLYVNLNKD